MIKKKLSLNTCFLELLEDFRRDSKNEFKLVMINEPSMLELWCSTVHILKPQFIYMPFWLYLFQNSGWTCKRWFPLLFQSMLSFQRRNLREGSSKLLLLVFISASNGNVQTHYKRLPVWPVICVTKSVMVQQTLGWFGAYSEKKKKQKHTHTHTKNNKKQTNKKKQKKKKQKKNQKNKQTKNNKHSMIWQRLLTRRPCRL